MELFNFDPFPKITTDRLLLRKLTLDDASNVFTLRTNKETNRYISRNIPIDLSDAEDFIKMIHNGTRERKNLFWLIVLKETGTSIGSITYHRISADGKYAEIGYELHPDFHKKGLMSEALQAVLYFGFHSMQLKTIEAFTHKNNTASKALLEKHLFVFQPERRDDGFENNRIFRLVNDSF